MSIKLFSIYSHSNTLRGIIIKPKDAVYPCKTAIVSHGFASNLTITSPYAKTLVKAGYVTVLFDFCMSGSGLSSGNSTGMSVLTEKENLMIFSTMLNGFPMWTKKYRACRLQSGRSGVCSFSR